MAAPALPTTFTRADLTAAGFEGWLTPAELRVSRAEVPRRQATAHVIFRDSTRPPAFKRRSDAGFETTPSVNLDRLRANWIDGARVLYIGATNDIGRRVREFTKFGDGKDDSHYGGRMLWQLEDAEDLLFAWHRITWGEPERSYKIDLIRQFVAIHQALPFANLQDPR
jgi:hypothetical protein